MTALFDGEYDDFDGLSVLFDAAAMRERYGVRGEKFETSVYGDLTRLIGAGEAVGFGMRQGSTFAVRVVNGRASGDVIDAGPLRTTGWLRLAGWHAFTYACAHRKGELDEDQGPALDVSPGWYRVTVARVPDPEDAEMFVSVEIGLEPITDPGRVSTPREIPGGDGFF